MIELRSRNIDRGEMAPNCLSHSLTTLGREGILLKGCQKRHCNGSDEGGLATKART